MLIAPTSFRFPAILIAGMPHCGKSVLAFLLSQKLRQINIAHYLLRAAPDGEGDWFLKGDPGTVRVLRAKNKAPTGYSAEFVAAMQRAVERRLLPLLVDVGGLPQGEQFGVLRACTHAILLYKDESGRLLWKKFLSEQGLPLIAELESTPQTPGALQEIQPFLKGSISGLERENPQTDSVFGALLLQVAGLLYNDPAYLEQIHLRQAQYPPLIERLLMKALDPQRENYSPKWEPADLPALQKIVAPDHPLSLYGRGPVWLAAMLGAHTCSAPMTIYDALEGWIPLPVVQEQKSEAALQPQVSPRNDFDWVEFPLANRLTSAEALSCLPLPGSQGVVLSGKLPRWAFAALARWLAPHKNWVAVYDPNLDGAVIVSSKSEKFPVGVLLKPPEKMTISASVGGAGRELS